MTVKIVVPMPERSSFCGFICLARMLKTRLVRASLQKGLWGGMGRGASHPEGVSKNSAG
jgi:hypothetical protein